MKCTDLSSSIGLRITGYALRTIPRLPPFENVPINLGDEKGQEFEIPGEAETKQSLGNKEPRYIIS